MDLGTSSLRLAWRVQRQTIHALLVRDLMMRYGRDNIGFAWVVLEPMILTVGVMVIWSLMGANKEGLKVVELVLTGYMPLTLWRHLTGPVVNMFRANASMLFHRRISLFDLVAARQALEIMGTSAALLVVYFVLNAIGVIKGVERLDLFLLGWLMMAWIGAASGAVLAAVSERYEVAERFVQPVQYLNIPISGAFFLVDWLPPWGQHIIMFHPLVHCYEVFRAGYFGETIVTHYNLQYFAACAFVLSFFGIVSVQKIKSRVRLT